MRFLLAVIICKILYFIGRQIGKGSSLPGRIALKLCPDVLKQLKLPETIIAVTGSNGKTSTVELIVHALESTGISTGWNREGSNQTEGIATALLRIADLKGNVRRGALVLECDERYARLIFKHIHPTVLVVTNLCRDQLTRNGHHEFIQDHIREAITVAGESTLLILNADDPFVAALAVPASASSGAMLRKENIIWFGIDPDAAIGFFRVALPDPGQIASHVSRLQLLEQYSARDTSGDIYNDGAFCPLCKELMLYKNRIAGHFGDYRCISCGFRRPAPASEITALDFSNETVTVNTGEKAAIRPLCLTGIYNFIAAVAAAGTAGCSESEIIHSLDDYELTGGRTVRLKIGDRNGALLISKHENSLSYNQSLTQTVKHDGPCTVVFMVDAISRKYYTSETSWLWDVDFDILLNLDDCRVILTGRYSDELMARFAMTAIDSDMIDCVPDRHKLHDHILKNTSGDIYAITCFSDRKKLLKALKCRK